MKKFIFAISMMLAILEIPMFAGIITYTAAPPSNRGKKIKSENSKVSSEMSDAIIIYNQAVKKQPQNPENITAAQTQAKIAINKMIDLCNKYSETVRTGTSAVTVQ